MGREFNPEPREDDLFDVPNAADLVVLVVIVLFLAVAAAIVTWYVFHAVRMMLA